MIVRSSMTPPISAEAAVPYVGWLARLHARGCVIASVCGGVFLLAEAGLLRGNTVTTYWSYADTLRERYAVVTVDIDRVVIEDGDIITAGGMTSWTDLGIRLIFRLLGPVVALERARLMLVGPSGRE